MNKKNKSIAAIIPAYNEEKRIGNVLKQISKSKLINEIIVVDDGSKDKTSEVVKKFKNIKLIRNKINMGKALSMEKGVKSTNCEIIFFCDADLKKITPKIIEKIIMPVIDGKFDMYLGLRGESKTEQLFKVFALNTGERALTKQLWEKVPKFYKYRYRIEVGLNYYAQFYGKGYGYENLDYLQTLKENKHGFSKGFFLRMWMYFDIFMAYVRAYVINLPLKKLLRR
ncbi:MAG: glycosyltransferase family 2 protein [Candidatus Woesearchaeota archaeon]